MKLHKLLRLVVAPCVEGLHKSGESLGREHTAYRDLSKWGGPKVKQASGKGSGTRQRYQLMLLSVGLRVLDDKPIRVKV